MPACALLGSRAAAEQSAPELRSFRRILRGRRDKSGLLFLRSLIFCFIVLSRFYGTVFNFAAGGSCCCCCCFCCDLGSSLSFVLPAISRTRGRYRFISTTSLRGSPSPSSTPLRLACFGTRLPSRFRIRVLLCTAAAAV